MTCKEARKLIIPFIHDELSMEDPRDFLQHVRGCKACMDELEIYYIIETKLIESQTEDKAIHMPSLKDYIINEYKRVYLTTILKIIYYAVNTLVILAAIFTVLLQLRIWIY